MRVRAGILAMVLAAALAASLAACGSGGDNKKPSADNTRLGTPSSHLTQTTLDCAKYADTAQKITEAQQELYAGMGGSTDALDALHARMNDLKDGAPANVKAAIDELNKAFDMVQEIIKNPSAQTQQDLAKMGPKLATDGQTITTYIVSQCKK